MTMISRCFLIFFFSIAPRHGYFVRFVQPLIGPRARCAGLSRTHICLPWPPVQFARALLLSKTITLLKAKMSVTDITPSLKKLDVDLDRLEETLKPLLGGVNNVGSKLPLLEEAKLNVLVCYAIESLLFCTPSRFWIMFSRTTRADPQASLTASERGRRQEPPRLHGAGSRQAIL